VIRAESQVTRETSEFLRVQARQVAQEAQRLRLESMYLRDR
jgi:hypothetical protein